MVLFSNKFEDQEAIVTSGRVIIDSQVTARDCGALTFRDR